MSGPAGWLERSAAPNRNTRVKPVAPVPQTGENVNNATLATMLSLVLIGLSIAPAAAAATDGGTGPGPSPCYQWYKEVDLGPVEIVSTSSCSYSVQESDDGEGPI